MTPIKFRCKRSGNTVSFTLEGDIEGMRKHEGYVEIKDEEIKVEEATKEVLKRGRPRKQDIPAFLE
jgi:hypothetical protein